MLEAIKNLANDFISSTKDKEIIVISHHDTDGITSAAIITKALYRLNKKFSIKIVKQIESEVIKEIKILSQNKIILFLDLASNSFNYLSEIGGDIYIIDHHEIITEIPKNIKIINPHLFNEEEVSSAGLTYLFAKQLDDNNIDLAYLAVIGMIGDILYKNIGKV